MSYIDEQKSSNPVLKGQIFQQTAIPGSEKMTLEGTLNKVSVSFFLLFISACYGWLQTSVSLMLIGLLGGLALALLTFFKKEWAPITVPLYALFEGLFLGALSHSLEKVLPGLVSQSILITVLILGVTLGAYRNGYLKATPRFRKMVILATATIAVMYVLHIFLGFFGSGLPMVRSSNWFGVAFSLFVVGVASMNLVLDFDFIEQAIASGLPKSMEWYGAFSLMVTIIWLYIEILRLVNKLRKN